MRHPTLECTRNTIERDPMKVAPALLKSSPMSPSGSGGRRASRMLSSDVDGPISCAASVISSAVATMIIRSHHSKVGCHARSWVLSCFVSQKVADPTFDGRQRDRVRRTLSRSLRRRCHDVGVDGHLLGPPPRQLAAHDVSGPHRLATLPCQEQGAAIAAA